MPLMVVHTANTDFMSCIFLFLLRLKNKEKQTNHKALFKQFCCISATKVKQFVQNINAYDDDNWDVILQSSM